MRFRDRKHHESEIFWLAGHSIILRHCVNQWCFQIRLVLPDNTEHRIKIHNSESLIFRSSNSYCDSWITRGARRLRKRLQPTYKTALFLLIIWLIKNNNRCSFPVTKRPNLKLNLGNFMAYQLLTLWSVESDAYENEHFQTWTLSSLIIANVGTCSYRTTVSWERK
jgi:hypothetical protein